MGLALAFSIVMLLLVIFGIVSWRKGSPAPSAEFVLLVVAVIFLGWKVFGPLLHE